MQAATNLGMAPTTYTTDTSAEAEAVQLELLRQMTPQQRIEKMCGLSQQVRQMAFQAIRRQHPEYSEDEVKWTFIALTYGQELSDEVRRRQQETNR